MAVMPELEIEVEIDLEKEVMQAYGRFLASKIDKDLTIGYASACTRSDQSPPGLPYLPTEEVPEKRKGVRILQVRRSGEVP